ncbi:hypothetical protein LIER_35889 [Lithospermum erythrorhizon]|uniref:KIB1-4 beta-propeller domain-containing protein n=1 Tax=Lithospermum erythrorhizon TaxID=34254 RepID=A0AAV3NYY8_LITER
MESGNPGFATSHHLPKQRKGCREISPSSEYSDLCALPFEMLRKLIWLVGFFNRKGEKVQTNYYNPLLGKEITDLPTKRIKTGFAGGRPDNFVLKVISSVDPSVSPNDFYVGATYEDQHELALLRFGEKSWRYIQEYPSMYAVYKVILPNQASNNNTGQVELEKATSLGGDALFIGDNHSMAIPAMKCPPGRKPDTIYFSSDPACVEHT